MRYITTRVLYLSHFRPEREFFTIFVLFFVFNIYFPTYLEISHAQRNIGFRIINVFSLLYLFVYPIFICYISKQALAKLLQITNSSRSIQLERKFFDDSRGIPLTP